MILWMFETFQTLFLNIPQQLSWLLNALSELSRNGSLIKKKEKKQVAEIRPKSQPGLVRHFPYTVKNDIAICNQLYRTL